MEMAKRASANHFILRASYHLCVLRNGVLWCKDDLFVLLTAEFMADAYIL